MDTQLYPGIPFSPPAALTDNVGAGDTIIPVSDVSAFPAAPNLATIGDDENGETVLYAAKTATALSGCVRGVEGETRAWSAGEPIARNWTAKDHADLIAAVGEAAKTAQDAKTAAQDAKDESDPAGTAAAAVLAHDSGSTAHEELFAAKQSKLTGTPGQVVGFGADGAAQAVQGWSNPNLLDNWYFVDPVNQRGQDTYTLGGYAIDRWKHYRSAITLETDGVGIQRTELDNGLFFEYIPIGQIEPGREYTFSALIKEIGLISVTASALPICPTNYITLGLSPSAEVRLEIAEGSASGNYWMQCSVRTYTADKYVIMATKLEKGAVQTLARQDADGNWVLNDPPPDKALELAKCQRYFVRYTYDASATVGTAAFVPTWLNLQLSGPNMRIANPAISIFSELVRASDGFTLPAPTNCVIRNGCINIGFALSGGGSATSYIYSKAGGYIDLDANL